MIYRYNRYSGMTYQERQAAKAVRAVELAAEKAARAGAAMTCQCCAQQFLANTGSMAHHGYKRPGSGWQTASCMGAKELPFEVSRDRLGYMIEIIKREIVKLETFYAETDAETRPIQMSWNIGTKYVGRVATKEYRRFDLTRDNVAEYIAAMRADRYAVGLEPFDYYKGRELASQQREIDAVKAELKRATERFDGWKQTHKAVGKGKATTWAPV